MNVNFLENKVREVFALVFKIPEEKVNESTSVHSIDKWDSLQHINLVSILEEEFSITLMPDQIIRMDSFKSIVNEILRTLPPSEN